MTGDRERLWLGQLAIQILGWSVDDRWLLMLTSAAATKAVRVSMSRMSNVESKYFSMSTDLFSCSIQDMRLCQYESF